MGNKTIKEKLKKLDFEKGKRQLVDVMIMEGSPEELMSLGKKHAMTKRCRKLV